MTSAKSAVGVGSPRAHSEPNREVSVLGQGWAVAEGVAFLVARQEPAGCWVDFERPVGRATAWTTGYVATMLARCAAARAAVAHAGRWLLAAYRPARTGAHRQRMPAGWGYNQE